MIPRRLRQKVADKLLSVARFVRAPVTTIKLRVTVIQERADNAIRRAAARVDADDRPCIACGAAGGTHCQEFCDFADRFTYTQREEWEQMKARHAEYERARRETAQ